MSREQLLIKEIRERLNELESILNNSPVQADPTNLRISDSTITSNGTIFPITEEQKIELCKFIVKTTDPQINIKRFVDKYEPSRCICYCLVKEIERREKFLSEGENLYYDESKKKYYSQCRMPCIKDNNNNCNRHTDSIQIDISRMKILTNASYNLSLDQSIKEYCKMYLSPYSSSESDVLKPSPVEDPKPAVEVPPKVAPVKKAPVEVRTKPAPVKKAAAVKAPKLKENSDIESGSDSEVDMIVSKVRESLKPAPPEEKSDSEAEDSEDNEDSDSDDCMLDADEIHDEEGNIYYIDEAKSVIKLDEDGYGVRLGMLKELKSGNIFYKNKSWKIDYFPKK
jgi:hypothetical protein